MQKYFPSMGFEKKSYLDTIIENVKLLADYAEDTKQSLDKVQQARKLLYRYDTDEKLGDEDVDQLLELENKLTPKSNGDLDCEVTLDSLRATGGLTGNQYFWTAAGRYMMVLWIILFLMIGAAAYAHYQISMAENIYVPGEEIPQDVSTKIIIIRYLNPFIFGTLGACAYLLRVTGKRLRTRTFDPARFPDHINRLFLGTLSGGMIIIFFEGAVVLEVEKGGIPLSAVALGFIAGYSVEFLYKTIDRIVSAIIPNISADVVKPEVLKKKHAQLTAKYSNLLDKMKSKASGDSTKNVTSDDLEDALKMIISDLRN